jgi:hypothetical protein
VTGAADGNLGAEEIRMQRIVVATLLGLALAGPATAQAPNVQQLLQGLTTGNQSQDQALRDAFERGYQRGRQDEARQQRSNRGGSDRSRDADDRNSSGYQDERRTDQPYGRQGGSSNR